MRDAARAGGDANDATVYSALLLYAEERLRAVRKVPPHAARHPVLVWRSQLYSVDSRRS